MASVVPVQVWVQVDTGAVAARGPAASARVPPPAVPAIPLKAHPGRLARLAVHPGRLAVHLGHQGVRLGRPAPGADS